MNTNLKMKFIKGFSALVILLLLSPSVKSQDRGSGKLSVEQKEKLKAHKIAFITERLQLTPLEAEKFWPVYNEHEALIEKSHKEFRKSHKFGPENIESMSEADALIFIEDHLKQEQQTFEQRKAFIGHLKTILPAKKILLLMEAEKDFRVEVVRKVAGKDGPPLPYDEKRMQGPVKNQQ